MWTSSFGLLRKHTPTATSIRVLTDGEGMQSTTVSGVKIERPEEQGFSQPTGILATHRDSPNPPKCKSLKFFLWFKMFFKQLLSAPVMPEIGEMQEERFH